MIPLPLECLFLWYTLPPAVSGASWTAAVLRETLVAVPGDDTLPPNLLPATVLGGGAAKRYVSALETRGASHEPWDIQATSRSEPPLLHHRDASRPAFAQRETLMAWGHAGWSKAAQKVEVAQHAEPVENLLTPGHTVVQWNGPWTSQQQPHSTTSQGLRR
jgi:hypothetical protein